MHLAVFITKTEERHKVIKLQVKDLEDIFMLLSKSEGSGSSGDSEDNQDGKRTAGMLVLFHWGVRGGRQWWRGS